MTPRHREASPATRLFGLVAGRWLLLQQLLHRRLQVVERHPVGRLLPCRLSLLLLLLQLLSARQWLPNTTLLLLDSQQQCLLLLQACQVVIHRLLSLLPLLLCSYGTRLCIL